MMTPGSIGPPKSGVTTPAGDARVTATNPRRNDQTSPQWTVDIMVVLPWATMLGQAMFTQDDMLWLDGITDHLRSALRSTMTSGQFDSVLDSMCTAAVASIEHAIAAVGEAKP